MKLSIKLLAAFLAASVAALGAETAVHSRIAAQPANDFKASAAVTEATVADAQAVVERLHVEKSIARFVGQMSQLIDQLNDNIIKKSRGRILAADLKQHHARVLEIITSSVNAARLKQEIAAVYAESFTKSELAALASAENLPPTLIERQAAVEQQANNLVMTHLADAMLAVKALNKNFAMQQHNKVAEALDEERDRKRERRRLTTLETGF